MTKENPDLLAQLPEHYEPAYDEGLGDDEPLESPIYGKPRIIWRCAQDGVTRAQAHKRATAAVGKFDQLFQTARFWCAVRFE